jgi:hypothetical protein
MKTISDEQFVEVMLNEAKKQGRISKYGYIQCNHKKTISREKLIEIHKLCKDHPCKPTTKEFKQIKIQGCCFRIYKAIVLKVYENQP